MSNPVRNYRVLTWACLALAVAAIAGCYVLKKRLDVVNQALAAEQQRSRLPDPHELAKRRDQNFEFVVRNYGFEYEGRTGDEIDDSVLFYGAWEKDMAFFMRDYLERRQNKSAVFIDVGCNAGHHSLFLSRLVKHIYAFDPFQPAVDRFHKLIERNGFDNITVHPVGLGAKNEDLPFIEPPKDNFGIGTFRTAPQPEHVPSGSLRVVRGDEALAPYKLSDVELVKIDVEGFEEAVLTGLRQTLETQRPVIVLEVTRPPGGTIASLQQLRDLVPERYDFLVLIAEEDTYLTGRYVLTDFEPQAAEFFASGFQANLIAYPTEKREQVPRRAAAASKAPVGTKGGSKR